MAAGLKLRFLALGALMVAFAGTVAAQDFTFGWNPRSGDAWVDSQLGDVNLYASRYRETFVDEMVRYYGAPRDLVTELLVTRRWAPGDVYYACAIAQTLGRPCRYVVDEWDRNHAKGWGAVATELGIKPGSAEFHRLKRGFVPTYDRWARPIDIDADLRRDFPNRGKGVKGSPGKAKVHAAPGRTKANAADHGKGSSGGKGKAPDKGNDRAQSNGHG